MYQFQKAISVWGNCVKREYNQFLGFYTEITVSKEQKVKIAIGARSYYRLYVNGKMAANGPARTAKNYCRVDEIMVQAHGTTKIAVEVTALDKPEKYSNDCTLEPGLFIAEITAEDGSLLTGTGDGNWKCKELFYRRSVVETMSHSRGIVEVYDIDTSSYDWIVGGGEVMEVPKPTDDQVTYLKRRAPYATYEKIPMIYMEGISDRIYEKSEEEEFELELPRLFNPKWYEMIPEEEYFLESLRNETDSLFTGECTQYLDEKTGDKMVSLIPGRHPASLLFSRTKSELGFIDFMIEVTQPCTLDIINSDYMHKSGTLKANGYVTRYHLAKGAYHLTTFEPKLTRYIQIILRTEGKVNIGVPQLLEDTYPDDNSCFFECSDGELNTIYETSKQTLRLNTLDIFMDCPQRERGGWLCDSQFTAFGAWQMFGDLSVEKDFIENFMLTNADELWHSFFPEVYPSSKKELCDTGITNWSFWLLTELADYYDRSGDYEFILKCQQRVTRFVEGMLELRGECGLLEGMKNQFVDWSLSNRNFCVDPISIPINCLAVCLLEKMSELYQVDEWKKAADEMREVIEKMDEMPNIFGGGGDSAIYENGTLKRGECGTESGVALELWSGFHTADHNYIKRFTDTMGYCPKYRSSPNIGKSNLFIGLMVRFDVLARLGKVDTLIKEFKDLYLPQIRDGSGTFFENYAEYSGCHGFNGAVGAMLTNGVLGLGQPMQRNKTIRITPHPEGLNWARGSARCVDGPIFINWSANHDTHVLDITLILPKGWTPEYSFAFELTGWSIWVNGQAKQLN